MTSGPVVPSGDRAIVKLRGVSPNARIAALQGSCGAASLKLRFAPPVDGKANAEVECFVAPVDSATPPGVRIARGFSGRAKTVFVDEVGAEWVRELFRSRQR